jgi:hypothetical protein
MSDGKFIDADSSNNLKEKYGTVFILSVEPTVQTSLGIY